MRLQCWRTYLIQAGKISPAAADKLLAAHREQFPRILDSSESLNLMSCHPATKKAVIKWWSQERHRAFAISSLIDLGLSFAFAKKAHQKWKHDAASILSANPYSLAEISGIGWTTADAYARNRRIAHNSTQRISSALIWVLTQASQEGHSCLPVSVWLDRAIDLLGADLRERVQHVQHLASRAWVVAGDYSYLTGLYEAEKEVADRFSSLTQAPQQLSFDAVSIEDLRQLSPHLSASQLQAIALSLVSPISVMTGLPGTGKTTAVRTAVRAAVARGESVLLLAPTGKAAKRLANLVDHPASTIHRAIGWNRSGSFPGARTRSLSADFVIIDESSMIDLCLMRDLLRSVRQGTRLWFIGDTAQLPSIGPGRVLADLIEHGGVPVVNLLTIHRQSANSPIVRLAHAVHQGRWPEINSWHHPLCVHVETQPQFVIAAVTERATDLIRRKEDVQILTAMRKGPDGSASINRAIQAAVNGLRPSLTSAPHFRENDRIVITANLPDWDLVNGDQGVIVGENASTNSIAIDIGERRLVMPRHTWRYLELAYATTIHKAQGSEWDTVILVLTTRQYPLLDRTLLYTAVTRARRQLILIGERRAFELAATNGREHRRHSTLFRTATIMEARTWNR